MVQHCRLHAEEGEVDLIHVIKCQHAGCSTIPSFGLEGGQPEFCKLHRAPHHKGLVGYRCSFAEGCAMRAAYGDSDVGTPRFCSRHRSKHHVDVMSRRCMHPLGCRRHVTTVVTNFTAACSSSIAPLEAAAPARGAQRRAAPACVHARCNQLGPGACCQGGERSAICRHDGRVRKGVRKGQRAGASRAAVGRGVRLREKSACAASGGGKRQADGAAAGVSSRDRRRARPKKPHPLVHLQSLGPALCLRHRDMASECQLSCNLTFPQAPARMDDIVPSGVAYAAMQSAAVVPPPPLILFSTGCDGVSRQPLPWRPVNAGPFPAARFVE